MTGKRLLRYGFWAAVVVAAVLVVRSVAGDDDPQTIPAEPEIVSLDELRDAAGSEETPIYWAGAQPDAELELSRPDESSVYVSYLTGGAEPGGSLTVGTYEFPGAVDALHELSSKPGGIRRTAPGGGIAYVNRARPQSVYLAYPGVDVEIEVYDPDPKRALSLVTSGQIVPIG